MQLCTIISSSFLYYSSVWEKEREREREREREKEGEREFEIEKDLTKEGKRKKRNSGRMKTGGFFRVLNVSDIS